MAWSPQLIDPFGTHLDAPIHVVENAPSAVAWAE
jgi:kynurenine formamidase